MGEAPALRWINVLCVSVSLLLLGCAVDCGPRVDASAARHGLQVLPGVHDVTHAVAAPAVGQLVLLSDETLWLVPPEGYPVESIELPAAVCGVAVQGRRAAVRHEGFLTFIDLPSRSLERIMEIQMPCGDVALTERYAYLLTRELNRHRVIQVPLTGGPPEATEVTFFGAGCRLALHPSGQKIYVACNDTVGRIGLDAHGRVDVDASFETRVDPGWGCNRIWVTGDGDWAYAACGGRLRSHPGMPGTKPSIALPASLLASGFQPGDLVPSGRLPMEGVTSMCETNGALAVIPARYSPHRVHNGLGWDTPYLLDEHAGQSLEIFSHPQLHPLASLKVPSFPSGDTARGETVLCGLRDGSVHVLVQGEDSQILGMWNVTLKESP